MSYADTVLQSMSYNWPYTWEELEARCPSVPKDELRTAVKMLVQGRMIDMEGPEDMTAGKFTKWRKGTYRSRQMGFFK